MEAVYTLLNVDRGVPEVWGSTYDVRALVDASVKLRDGRKLTDMELPLMGRIALKEALKKNRRHRPREVPAPVSRDLTITLHF